MTRRCLSKNTSPEALGTKEVVQEGDGAEEEIAKEWQRKTGTSTRRRRNNIAESPGNHHTIEGLLTSP